MAEPKEGYNAGIDRTIKGHLSASGDFVDGSHQPHNRFFSPIAETEATLGHLTWTEAEAVYKVRFHFREVTGTLVAGTEIRIVFDASPVDDTTDTTQAWNWIDAGGPSSSESLDVEYFSYIVTADDEASLGITTRWYEFSSPLRRVDICHMGGTAAANAHEISVTAEVA